MTEINTNMEHQKNNSDSNSCASESSRSYSVTDSNSVSASASDLNSVSDLDSDSDKERKSVMQYLNGKPICDILKENDLEESTLNQWIKSAGEKNVFNDEDKHSLGL